jgi:predicted MFS family arabinose efflux permease
MTKHDSTPVLDAAAAPPAAAPAAARRRRVPLTQPLRHPLYRRLWCANFVSNLGTWVQTFAAAWLVASSSDSASSTSLVQTSTYIPVFLFALFAGVVADAVHRPKLLFLCNLYVACGACLMAALAMHGHPSHKLVLGLIFCLGCGSAFMWPAWQAALSGLVEPEEVEAAATLNNLSFNTAAILGPALGGVLFKWLGAGPLFLLNAVSFSGLLAVYWSWWRQGGAQPAPCDGYAARLRQGLQLAFGCPRYRRILCNVATVFFATIAFASLLPVFVRDVLRMDASVFGVLMGSLGGGAVCAAFGLPAIRARVDKTGILAGALLVYGIMLLALPFLRSLTALVPLIVCGGMAWSATVSTMNAAAQLSFPAGVRARTLAIYLFVMAGGSTLGSLFWGRFADAWGVRAAFATAGACVLVNAALLVTGNRKHPI